MRNYDSAIQDPSLPDSDQTPDLATVDEAISDNNTVPASFDGSTDQAANSTFIAPSNQTTVSANPSPDLTVFAALAESLESTFYSTALAKFTPQSFEEAGFVDGQLVFDQLTVIQEDEKTHLTTLQSVAKSLGGDTSDIDTCQFNFTAATSSVQAFLATARVLEFVGIDAYIGGATLIQDKSLLVGAGQILTVEARHNTILNTFNAGSAIPSAFDMVLTPQQVLSLAAPFVSGGCDPVVALGLTPTRQLTISNTDAPKPGTLLTFAGAGLEGVDQSALFCNMIVGGATEAVVFPVAECVVPDQLDGPVHVFVTNSPTPLSSNIIAQDGSIIVAGPAIAFIDTISNAESQLLLGKKSDAGSGDTSSFTNGDQSTAEGSSSSSNNSASQASDTSDGYNSGNYSSSSTTPTSHRVEEIIITEFTVKKMREQSHVIKPAHGEYGGAIALGWS